ncbi:hypothetical protein DM807_13145 [Pseudomonas hunanensis]|nr:hypothetical protein [Pseudomonas hunanensis]RNF63693.1 hypothetical protein EFJ98_28410 [Pseudomonas putida]
MDDRQHCKFIQIVSHAPCTETAHPHRHTIIGLKAPPRLCRILFSSAKGLNKKAFSKTIA